MHYLTWDTGIAASFGLLLAYSLLIRKHMALAGLVGVYVGYAVTSVLGQRAFELVSGQRVLGNQLAIQISTSQALVKFVLLVLMALLVAFFVKLGGKRARYGAPEVVLYSVATIAVAIAFLAMFMSPADLETLSKSSQAIRYASQWREWIVGVPIALVIFFGIYKDEEL